MPGPPPEDPEPGSPPEETTRPPRPPDPSRQAGFQCFLSPEGQAGQWILSRARTRVLSAVEKNQSRNSLGPMQRGQQGKTKSYQNDSDSYTHSPNLIPRKREAMSPKQGLDRRGVVRRDLGGPGGAVHAPRTSALPPFCSPITQIFSQPPSSYPLPTLFLPFSRPFLALFPPFSHPFPILFPSSRKPSSCVLSKLIYFNFKVLNS